MKKMQCEVCGSTDIKKIDDTTFECQSCGVQYAKDEVQKLLVEVTGSVKIDRSEEIKNTLKRAENFEKEGNIQKAEQYYNAVLDLDPENERAIQRLEYIRKESAKPQNIYILERNLSAEESFDTFLQKVKTLKNIAPDIYKEIEIISKTEKYYPFAIMYGTYSGTYSGTACYKKEVPVPVEKVQEKFINGQFRKVKETVIEYRTEIDKKPASGSYTAKCRKIYSLSSSLTNIISNMCLSKAKKKPDLIAQLEAYYNDSYGSFCDNIHQIDIDSFNYDIPLSDSFLDDKLMRRAKELYDKSVDNRCSAIASDCVGGDYPEQVSFNRHTDSQKLFYLYIPIQVVEYAYKGDIYVSTMALVGSCQKNNLVYPYYNKIDHVSKEGDCEIDKVSYNGTYGVGALCFALLSGLVWGWVNFWKDGKGSAISLLSEILLFITFCFVILAVLQATLGIIKLIQTKKLKKEYLQKMGMLSRKKDSELIKEYNTFFSNYKGIESIEKCTEMIRKSSIFNCKDEEVSCRINADDESYDEDEDEDEDDDEE